MTLSERNRLKTITHRSGPSIAAKLIFFSTSFVFVLAFLSTISAERIISLSLRSADRFFVLSLTDSRISAVVIHTPANTSYSGIEIFRYHSNEWQVRVHPTPSTLSYLWLNDPDKRYNLGRFGSGYFSSGSLNNGFAYTFHLIYTSAWPGMIVIAGLSLFWGVAAIRNSRHEVSTACPTCGYDLRGSIESEQCPECGTAITPARRERLRAAGGRGEADSTP